MDEQNIECPECRSIWTAIPPLDLNESDMDLRCGDCIDREKDQLDPSEYASYYGHDGHRE